SQVLYTCLMSPFDNAQRTGKTGNALDNVLNQDTFSEFTQRVIDALKVIGIDPLNPHIIPSVEALSTLANLTHWGSASAPGAERRGRWDKRRDKKRDES